MSTIINFQLHVNYFLLISSYMSTIINLQLQVNYFSLICNSNYMLILLINMQFYVNYH